MTTRLFTLGAVLVTAAFILLWLSTPAVAAEAGVAAQDNSSESGQQSLTIESESGDIALSAENDIQADVGDGDLSVDAQRAANGYWRATDIYIEQQTVEGFTVNVGVKDQLEGVYDPSNEVFYATGTFVIEAPDGTEVEIPVNATTQGDDVTGNFGGESTLLLIRDYGIQIPATDSELINQQLGLPAEGEGSFFRMNVRVTASEAESDLPGELSVSPTDGMSDGGLQANLTTGESSVQSYEVKNTGFQPVTVTGVEQVNGQEVIETSAGAIGTLQPGESATMDMRLNATTPGTYTADFRVNATGEPSGEQIRSNTFSVTGTVTGGSADIQVTETTITPTDVVAGESVTIAVTAENTGDIAGTEQINIAVGAHGNTSYAVELERGEQVTENVSFTMSDAGTYTVEVNDNAHGEVVVSSPDPGEGGDEAANTTNEDGDADDSGGGLGSAVAVLAVLIISMLGWSRTQPGASDQTSSRRK